MNIHRFSMKFQLALNAARFAITMECVSKMNECVSELQFHEGISCAVLVSFPPTKLSKQFISDTWRTDLNAVVQKYRSLTNLLPIEHTSLFLFSVKKASQFPNAKA